MKLNLSKLFILVAVLFSLQAWAQDGGDNANADGNGGKVEANDSGTKVDAGGTTVEVNDNGAKAEVNDNGAKAEVNDNGAKAEANDNGAKAEANDNGAKAEANDNTNTPEEPALTEEESDYVMLAGTVACYHERIKDPDKAQKAVAFYLEQEGFTLEEFGKLQKAYASKKAVREAIKDEMEMCPSRVLATPPEVEDAVTPEKEEVAPAEETQKENKDTPKKPKRFSYAKKKYKGSVTGNGITKSQFYFGFDKKGKMAFGAFNGRMGKAGFSLSLKGTRNKDKLVLRSRSKKNTGTATVTLHGKKKTATVTFTGKINGRTVKKTFTVRTR